METQSDWRFCKKCNDLFFDGYSNKGICSAGGGHEAIGYIFSLPHDTPETETAQSSWRFCKKCSVMFFDGYPNNKGICSVGGDGHEASGYTFVLPHDVPETVIAQSSWRFCVKCNDMFFDGYPQKGICSAGGEHESAGYNFVLPHPPTIKIELKTGFNDPNNPDFTPRNLDVKGVGFSPNGNVKVACNIDVGNSLSSFETPGIANNEGEVLIFIPLTEYDLSHYSRISIRVTDLTNNVFADALKER
jgi:hypothetical protein